MMDRETVEPLLVHLRYLIGCQLQAGDFDEEPRPTDAEWKKSFDQIEDLLSDQEDA